MTVFKTFWNVVKKYKGTIILYTVILISFTGINMTSNDNQNSFTNSKPNILIINEDENSNISKNLVNYIENNSNIIDVKNTEEAINDALFYREVNFIIYIPKNYGTDILNGLNPQINIKTTGDYHASLAEMILSRYIKIQNIYTLQTSDENELIASINDNLSTTANIEKMSKIDTEKTSAMAVYFNFASYSIMAIVIYVVCLVLSSFRENSIHKRTIISSMNYKKHNTIILIGNFVYTIIVWVLIGILSIICVGADSIFTERGLIYLLNSFVFTFCALTIALFIGSIINNKNAVNGVVNVIALGSAFLCGAFVPVEWLPTSVLNIAHVLPAYWYINSNELLKTMEVIDFNNLQPIFVNCLVMLGFSVIFIILNNIVTKFKQKVG